MVFECGRLFALRNYSFVFAGKMEGFFGPSSSLKPPDANTNFKKHPQLHIRPV
jgi:hypothetical protein